ncbi:MAG: DUF2231 domain-containing protein [Patescibacteria group bacterium]
MNIHPLFVHFPIALLMLYSILELIKVKNIEEKFNLLYTKSILLFAGMIGGFVALQTGDIASHLLPRDERTSILHFHEMFAQMSIFLYGILAFGYILKFIEPYLTSTNFKFNWLVTDLRIIILSPIVSINLSILGFITLTITGGLGGILVYGPNVDFVTTFLYTIFKI